jgi:uncharacterized RDD family membrane protein YckC
VPYCTSCGAEEQPDQQFCTNCGRAVSTSLAPPNALPYFPTHTRTSDAAAYASFWWRALGFLLDSLILGLIVNLPLRASHVSSYTAAVIGVSVSFVYGTAFLTRNRGQTIGMRIVRVRCVDGAGFGPISVAQAVRRTAMYCALDLFGTIYHYTRYIHPTAAQTIQNTHHALVALLFIIPLAVDMLWPNWDKRRQTLHDKFASTVVLRPAAGVVTPAA